jgi:hypothetical protein
VNIDGVEYELVVERPEASVYRATGTFLRIGPRELIGPEFTSHRELLRLGFPVPRLLSSGHHAGAFYYIEESAGDVTFGDLFDTEAARDGRISPASFGRFLEVIGDYTQAQLRVASSDEPSLTFTDIVRPEDVATTLPHLANETRGAYQRSVERLSIFPAVLTHGDFHAFNVCPGGVIDFEQITWGYAGYDVIGALVTPELFPPDPDAYRFSDTQVAEYRSRVDEIFSTHGYPLPSSYIEEFRICRMMSLVAGRKRPPTVLKWLDEHYEVLLGNYVRCAG